MADINSTVLPVIEPIANIVNTVKLLVGGVFGLYLILAIVKIKEYFYVKRQLKKLRKSVDDLTVKVNTLTRQQKTVKKKSITGSAKKKKNK